MRYGWVPHRARGVKTTTAILALSHQCHHFITSSVIHKKDTIKQCISLREAAVVEVAEEAEHATRVGFITILQTLTTRLCVHLFQHICTACSQFNESRVSPVRETHFFLFDEGGGYRFCIVPALKICNETIYALLVIEQNGQLKVSISISAKIIRSSTSESKFYSAVIIIKLWSLKRTSRSELKVVAYTLAPSSATATHAVATQKPNQQQEKRQPLDI